MGLVNQIAGWPVFFSLAKKKKNIYIYIYTHTHTH